MKEIGENSSSPELVSYQNDASESNEAASITISLSEDKLEARANFVPASGNGALLTLDQFYSVMEKYNITYGLLHENINNAIFETNVEKITLKGVLIAKGTLPVDEVGEYLLLNPLLKQKKNLSISTSSPAHNRNRIPNKNKRIDYKQISSFIIVRKGQILARLIPKKSGNDGMNVHGTPIPYKVINPKGVQGGNNTQMSGSFLLSAISGQMTEVNGIIQVDESLNIKGPVDYRTGNIAFPGDVIIEGPVSDGFKLYSGASITIKQTLDVTDAVTKGDLVVAGGIIGRGPALVKVGGNLRTKFVENCRIACRKTVFVGKEIINSKVYAMENIEMGEKSLIIGSEIYAVNGLRAGSIGKASAPTPNIRCGVDFTIEQEKNNYNNMLRLLTIKLARLKQLLEEPHLAQTTKANLEALCKKLEEDQHTATERITELLRNTTINENAFVEVYGEIATGTLIEICKAQLIVPTPLRKVRISLDKSSGKLLVDKM
ncbi:MAG: FapA family protein [Treponema sp.]|jgi:uncharacterized protein (DUF342 family)|nr:FapA family protein [Treponema sp.]